MNSLKRAYKIRFDAPLGPTKAVSLPLQSSDVLVIPQHPDPSFGPSLIQKDLHVRYREAHLLYQVAQPTVNLTTRMTG